MRAARRAIRKRMRSGEIIELEDSAVFLLDDGRSVAWRDVLIAVTDEHLIWVDLKRPKAGAMSMRHDDVVRATYDGQTLRLSRRDPADPKSATDTWFSFPYGDRGVSALNALEARLGRLRPPGAQAAS
jgi:hypothetical protein